MTEGETKICLYCGEEILAVAKKCKYCGEFLDDSLKNSNANIATNSELPKELKRFNWGACLLPWIWGIGNNVRVALWGLLCFLMWIPVIGAIIALGLLIFQIWLGINGNRLAWNSKRWNNIEHFNDVQRKWAMWSVIILFGVPFAIAFIAAFISSANGSY